MGLFFIFHFNQHIYFYIAVNVFYLFKLKLIHQALQHLLNTFHKIRSFITANFISPKLRQQFYIKEVLSIMTFSLWSSI